MLYVERQKLDTVEDLRIALANAIRLEFSTIPPYLTALYSIKDGTNRDIAKNIRTIVIQEMLHLTLAANILSAVGGVPDFPASIPKYPGRLPMNIGSEPGKPFIVPLKKLSHETVREVFMVIEEPEHPIEFPEKKVMLAVAPDYHTIGEFYEAVSKLIADLGEPIFTGDPARQVTGWFASDELFPVTSVATAQRAIEIIVTQGEGTQTSPAGGPSGLAHYYRFEEIARGQTLTRDLPEPPFYSWGPPAIVLDDDGVWPVVDNAPDVPLPSESPVATLSRQCDRTFSALVDALQETFNGNPGHLDAAIGLMYSLRLQAQELVSMPIPGRDVNAGPRFLYDPATASG
ncbi:MAG: ferritin-like protein [Acidobacteriota bacterium]|nr:ferritin-like protein [Acidobacteriota bacterium]